MRLERHRAARLVAGDDGGLLDALAAGRDITAGPDGLRDTGGDGRWIRVASGGTTGAPKVIRRSAASWRASFEVNARLFDIGPGAVVATLGHVGHSLTLYALAEAAALGAGLLGLQGMRPDAQLRALSDHGATHLWATPTQLGLLAGRGAVPTLDRLIVGGGVLTAAQAEAARVTFPTARLSTFYGASELSFVTVDGTPFPGVELRLRDGLIWVRSPYLFDGYDAGADPLTRRDADGFVTVGELGHMEKGRLVVTGRAGRQVNVADRLVSPEPAEQFLADRAGAPVAVVAVPDPRRGARLVAVRQGKADPSLDAALLADCRRAVGAAGTPHRVVTVPTLPRLPSGKPDLDGLAHTLAALA
ncbi:long-chain acyl-CoA synthetase [Palleronia salina]|uniref:Long-chain acyl-CoA synthetase n=1 Tax=Palleronia salina TaxID=313368 RepID=A0A1M6JNJ1_9RHOB|nr:AMP-binding protein [Palleronia salina]SHJ48234.1 long-chain acyl-CoA synthetase [Palleronia salina]